MAVWWTWSIILNKNCWNVPWAFEVPVDCWNEIRTADESTHSWRIAWHLHHIAQKNKKTKTIITKTSWLLMWHPGRVNEPMSHRLMNATSKMPNRTLSRLMPQNELLMLVETTTHIFLKKNNSESNYFWTKIKFQSMCLNFYDFEFGCD